MLLGYLLFGSFFWADLLRAVAEDVALAIGPMKFGAGRTDGCAKQNRKSAREAAFAEVKFSGNHWGNPMPRSNI